jgi:hypothetical protein
MITLVPVGGLCNRMRAIAAAHDLSKKLETTLNVIWIINNDLGAAYIELFKPTELFKVVNLSPGTSLIDRLVTRLYLPPKAKPFNKIIPILQRSIYKPILTTQDLPTGRSNDRSLENRLAFYRSALLISFGVFYNMENTTFSLFEPVAEIQQDIRKTVSLFTHDTVGVHIRRQDNTLSIEKSPTEAFVQAMTDELNKHPNTQFYLATDCQKTEQHIISNFGNRIITWPKARSRSTPQGIRDAVVDLYALSKTSKILGSYWSSFSTTAAKIGSVDKVVIKATETTILPTN